MDSRFRKFNVRVDDVISGGNNSCSLLTAEILILIMINDSTKEMYSAFTEGKCPSDGYVSSSNVSVSFERFYSLCIRKFIS